MINLCTKGYDSGYLVVLSYGFNIWSPWNVQANLINEQINHKLLADAARTGSQDLIGLAGSSDLFGLV